MRLLFELVLLAVGSTVLGMVLFFGLALYNHYAEKKQQKEDADNDFYLALLDELDRKLMEKRERLRTEETKFNDDRWVS